jgi:hypothetical protein
MTRLVSPLVVLLAVIGLLTPTARVSAGERPYLARGTAQFVSPFGDFVGSGHATHLGAYTEMGNASISPTGEIDGWAIYFASNGDILCATITGQLDEFGRITATVTYDGGTGRFDDAEGSSTLTGQLLPGGAVTVTVEGTIDY